MWIDRWTDRQTDKKRTNGITPISKGTIFVLESGNEKYGRTDGCRTHQSDRRVGYTQPT